MKSINLVMCVSIKIFKYVRVRRSCIKVIKLIILIQIPFTTLYQQHIYILFLEFDPTFSGCHKAKVLGLIDIFGTSKVLGAVFQISS